MARGEDPQFPANSLNDSGEIVDLGLWVDEFEEYFDKRIIGEIEATIRID